MPDFAFLYLSSDQISIKILEAQWLFWSLWRLESQGEVDEGFSSALDFDNFTGGSIIARRLSGSRFSSDKSHKFDLRFLQPPHLPLSLFLFPSLISMTVTNRIAMTYGFFKKHFKFCYIFNKEKYIFYFSIPEFQKPLISSYSVTR